MADANLPRADYYVYEIRDLEGCVIYIGKGSGRRDRHLTSGRGPKLLAEIKAGRTVPPARVADGMTEDAAFALEIELIARYGRRSSGGQLFNILPGGPGSITAGAAVGWAMPRTAIQLAQAAKARAVAWAKPRSPAQNASAAREANAAMSFEERSAIGRKAGAASAAGAHLRPKTEAQRAAWSAVHAMPKTDAQIASAHAALEIAHAALAAKYSGSDEASAQARRERGLRISAAKQAKSQEQRRASALKAAATLAARRAAKGSS